MSKKVLIALAVIVLSILAVSLFVFSDIGVFATTQQNATFCNVQGYVFNPNSVAVKNGTSINCTLIRNNGLSTNYTTLTGVGVPNGQNNSYRCTMMCSNVVSDSISVFAYNNTDNGTSSSTMSGSTTFLNITFNDYTNPTISGVTGNISSYTNQTISIDANASDNTVISSVKVILGNNSIINMTYISQQLYRASLGLPSNETSTITYYVAGYDASNNNASSATYYVTFSDNIVPTASASVNQSSVNQNVAVLFNGSGSSDNIGVTSYIWNFTDGATNNTAEPLHGFTNPGVYNVNLTVSDSAGNKAYSYVSVTVRDSVAPYVISNSPNNGTTNVLLNTSINITFNEALSTSTLNNNNIDVRDISGMKVYCNISFDATTNMTKIQPYIPLKESTVYLINITENIQDSSTNNMTRSVFNFTTIAKDTDNDGTPDSTDDDDDNDGIADANDKIKGTALQIKTSFSAINISVNSSYDINQTFNTVSKIVIVNGSTPTVIFNTDLSSRNLDLSNITVYESSNNSVGEMFVNGLQLGGQTKTIYLTKKSSYGSVCVKDSEITSTDEISQACTGTSEYKIYCNGTAQNSYTCTLNSTVNKYMISGLSYSGLREIDYTPPSQNNGGNNNNNNNGNAGGGGGGGGGGGDEECISSWVCGEWGKCTSDSLRYRECTDVNECSPATGSPTTSMYCVYAAPVFQEPGPEEETAEEEPTPETKQGTEQTQQLEQTATEEVVKTPEKGEKDLVGKAFETIKNNKANAYFLMLIVLIILSLVIFNLIHEKKREN
jgi:hypothetical protein